MLGKKQRLPGALGPLFVAFFTSLLPEFSRLLTTPSKAIKLLHLTASTSQLEAPDHAYPSGLSQLWKKTHQLKPWLRLLYDRLSKWQVTHKAVWTWLLLATWAYTELHAAPHRIHFSPQKWAFVLFPNTLTLTPLFNLSPLSTFISHSPCSATKSQLTQAPQPATGGINWSDSISWRVLRSRQLICKPKT